TVIIKGLITQADELIVSGSICKGDRKFNTTFILDTGFRGEDVAIPFNISQELGLEPSGEREADSPVGTIKLEVGDDAELCLGDKVYRVSYVLHYGAYPLISVTFLRRASNAVAVNFAEGIVFISLR
ncbi:hypothetical protein, partial [Acidilobus sp.]|uniref:hypothetical protein n=1 Tax=Acidilobus sp. TaxID=1872109 RepID=UPI003CFC6994